MGRNKEIWIKIGSKKNERKMREKILEEYETTNGFEWHVLQGWKQIRDYCGLQCSIQTVRRLAIKYHMPLYRMNNRPTTLKHFMKHWWLEVSRRTLELRKTDTP